MKIRGLVRWVMALAVLASVALGQNGGGNTVGGNGDRVSGWFTSLGFELLTDLERAEKNGQTVMPECPAAEFKQALATQVVLVDATNSAMLTNKFGEIKDIKVVWHEEDKAFLILLDRKLWTEAYDRKEADYRMVLHAYVLAAGKRDRNYLVTRQVNLPRLLSPRPATFERRTSLVWVQPASDGGFIGVGNSITVRAELVENNKPNEPAFRPYFLPHDHLVKLNASGEEEWRQELIAHIRSILPTDDGGYLILGLKRKDPGDPTESPAGRPRREVDKSNRDRNAFAFAVKLNRGGEAEWKRSYCTYETSDGACAEVNLGAFEKPDGNFVILSANSIHEMDPSGAIDGKKIQLVETHRPHSVEPLREGGAIVAGLKNGDIPYAAQFKADGHVLWERELDFRGEPGPIVPTKGGFLFGGSRRKEEGTEAILLKLDLAGTELWRKALTPLTEAGKPLMANVPGVPDPKNPNERFVFALSPVLADKPGGQVRSIVPLPNGGFVIAVGHSLKGEERWSLRELSSLGDNLWELPVGKDPLGVMAYPGDGGLVVPQGGRLLKIRTTLKKGKIDF